MSTVVNLGTLGSAGFLIQGDASADFAGFSVSDAGDFNGDGFEDVIVGAPFNDLGGNAAGAAYVIFGGPGGFEPIDLSNLQAADGVRVQGVSSGDLAGLTVSSAGDVNGDGFDDVLIGVPSSGYGAFTLAYLIFGEATPPASINLSSLAPSDGFAMFGDYTHPYVAALSVSGAGDVNGDGFADIIVGSKYDNPGAGSYGSAAGAAYVVFGHSGAFGSVDLTSLSPTGGFEIIGAPESYAGTSVSGAGDVNGDGFDDIIVGVPYGSDAGQAYVIFGKASGFGTIDLSNLVSGAGFVIQGAVAGDYAGFSVSSAGDVNGDGFADIIVGASYADNIHDVAGEAYVIFGKANGFGTIDLSNLAPGAGFAIFGDDSADHAGWSVSNAGDVNNDGFDDILVGAPFNDHTRSGVRVIDAGEAYVIYGRAGGFGPIDLTNLSPSQGFVIQGEAAGDTAGFSISSAGDVDGDGFDDLMIGAPSNGRGGPSAGAAYIISGRRDFPADVSGDFNGDGRDDVLLRHDNGWMTEWISQLNGSFSDNGAVASKWAHPAWQVAATGDFNGDGRDDVLLRHSNGWMTEWLGQLNGSFSDNGAVASSWFHPDWQVVGTGDFNGDTRDDLLLRNGDGTFVERLGQANGSFASNNAANDWADPNWHVEATNDFNGDGHDDLLLRHNDGWLVKWFGQADGSFSDNGVAGNWVHTAWQVAATGDFNGDGEDDILLRHNDGSIVEWLGQENGSFLVNNAARTSLNAAWDIVSTGRFNNDTRDDLLLRHDDGTIAQWLGQMNGSFLANNAATTWAHPNWHTQPTNDVLL